MHTTTPITPPPQQPEHESYQLLMSLSLDGLLDAEEDQTLARHLQSCPSCEAVWQRWQRVDVAFQQPPPVMAPDGFGARMAERIAHAEKQRALQIGVLMAGASMLMWAVGLICVGLMTGWLLYNQIGLMAEALQWTTQSWILITSLAASTWQVLLGLGSNPSAVGGAVAYAGLFTAILYGWSKVLQRSIQPLDV